MSPLQLVCNGDFVNLRSHLPRQVINHSDVNLKRLIINTVYIYNSHILVHTSCPRRVARLFYGIAKAFHFGPYAKPPPNSTAVRLELRGRQRMSECRHSKKARVSVLSPSDALRLLACLFMSDGNAEAHAQISYMLVRQYSCEDVPRAYYYVFGGHHRCLILDMNVKLCENFNGIKNRR